MISALPQNVWGDWVLQRVRQLGIGVQHIIRKEGRQGVFLLEEGQGLRPSSVVYDRQHTAFCAATPSDWHWPAIFQNAPFFHWSGVSPGIAQSTALLTQHAVAEAAAAGCFISCDLNYRAKLWQYGTAPAQVMPALVAKTNLVLGGPDAIETMLGLSLGDTGYRGKTLRPEDLRAIGQRLFERFPCLQYWAMSLRTTHSATDFGWQGFLCSRGEAVFSRQYQLANSLDRVGTGDAFMAGLLRGLTQQWPPQQTVDFAAAAGAFKHYIAGDICLSTEAELMELAYSGNTKINR